MAYNEPMLASFRGRAGIGVIPHPTPISRVESKLEEPGSDAKSLIVCRIDFWRRGIWSQYHLACQYGMKPDKGKDMNKKPTNQATGVKSKKLKLNRQTQRDLIPRDQKTDSVRGGKNGVIILTRGRAQMC